MTYSEKTIAGDAKTAVAQLTGTIDKEISRATTSVKNNLATLKSFGKSSETTALSLLQTTVTTNLKEIKDAAANAELHGFDPSGCVNNKDEEIKNSVSLINNQMVALVNGNLTNADKIRTTAENNIKTLSQSVAKLQTKLTGCAVGIPGLICYTEVIAEASKLMGDLPKKIVSLENKALTDLESVKALIIESTYVVVNEAQIDISNQTQDVTQCINELQLNPILRKML